MYQSNEWCNKCNVVSTCLVHYPDGSNNPGTIKCMSCGHEAHLRSYPEASKHLETCYIPGVSNRVRDLIANRK